MSLSFTHLKALLEDAFCYRLLQNRSLLPCLVMSEAIRDIKCGHSGGCSLWCSSVLIYLYQWRLIAEPCLCMPGHKKQKWPFSWIDTFQTTTLPRTWRLLTWTHKKQEHLWGQRGRRWTEEPTPGNVPPVLQPDVWTAHGVKGVPKCFIRQRKTWADTQTGKSKRKSAFKSPVGLVWTMGINQILSMYKRTENGVYVHSLALLYVNFTRIFRVFKKSRVTTENKKLLFPFSCFLTLSLSFLGCLERSYTNRNYEYYGWIVKSKTGCWI